MLDEKQLKQVNHEYQEMAGHWNYFYRSYMGGHQYRDGAYLRKYLNEDSAPGDQYAQRLTSTALQNHVKSIVHIYRSYLFRQSPTRQLSNLLTQPEVEDFVQDVDLNGTDINAFMKKINDGVMVYGSMWCVVDRPAYRTLTRAEELQLGIRAYVNSYVPSNVLDWAFEPDVAGRNKLTYLKLIEHSGTEQDQIVVWYQNKIERYWVTKETVSSTISTIDSVSNNNIPEINYGKIERSEQYINPLGYIPAFKVSADDGNSQIADIADTQRSIYNKLSELEQAIRISGHPTLVKTAEAVASAGAGGMIIIDEDTPDGLKPYLLQPNGSTIGSIIESIEQDVTSIDKMAHVSGIRGSVGTPMSGVALQTEMQMLNARLSDFSEILQESEYKIWDLFSAWQGIEPDENFEIMYEKSFDIRDRHSDIELLRKAQEMSVNNLLDTEIQRQIAKLIVDDEAVLTEILGDIDSGPIKSIETTFNNEDDDSQIG